jgi:hypothetical protein
MRWLTLKTKDIQSRGVLCLLRASSLTLCWNDKVCKKKKKKKKATKIGVSVILLRSFFVVVIQGVQRSTQLPVV